MICFSPPAVDHCTSLLCGQHHDKQAPAKKGFVCCHLFAQTQVNIELQEHDDEDLTGESTRREVNKGGLPMLYEILLEIAGPELKCALEVTKRSSDGNNK